MKNKLKAFFVGLIAVVMCLFVGAFFGCKDTDKTNDDSGIVEEEDKAASVTLDKTTLSLTVGDGNVTLTATVKDSSGNVLTGQTLEWSSSDTAVVTVSGGVVTVVGEGTATITVTVSGTNITATCAVTVSEAAVDEPAAIASVVLDEAELNLTVGGDDVSLTATVKDENGDTVTDAELEWSSSDTAVVTVSGGVVTVVGEGTATITVTVSGTDISATCEVTVSAQAESEQYEWVTSSLDYDAAIEAAGGAGSGYLTTEELTIGRFTFEAGVYFESSASGGITGGVVNNQQKKISFTLQGTDNKISFSLKGASGSGCTMTLYKADGTVVYTWDTVANSVTVLGLTVENLEAGEYYLDSVGSGRVGELAISEYLQKSDAVSIRVSGAQTQFLMDDAFTSTGLNVTLVYANGREDVLTSSQYEVDSTNYDASTAGTYQITVTYGDFQDTYSVYVYEIESITLYDYSLDSSRVTQNVQKVFIVGSEFNSDYLAVQATATTPYLDGTVTFILSTDDFVVTAPDMSSTGSKEVTVSTTPNRGDATAMYTINVVDNVFTSVKGTYTINVDVNGTVSVTSESVTFTSINDALKYFEITQVPEDSAKIINVAAGTYNEKVEVNMPNVSIIGQGDSASDTVLVFNGMNGILDPSGTTTYSTDGSATISIRAAATGFYAENITFQNYYNTNDRYNEAKEITSDTQAVAALVQADMSKFVNVRFSSYHDTLYAQIGRQYYENCYIEGRTDYIFGYNATAYFYNCTLLTIGSGDEKNGGYVVATKGLSQGATVDAIKYGYIFDNCDFTADENVVDGTVSLARGWDTEMKVMIMNSTISAAYSTEAYGDTSSAKNDRYTKMNADPVADYLLEYNNTGDGAIAESIENTCTVVGAETAAEYADLSLVFGTENGLVTYADAWNPVTSEDKVAVTGVTLSESSLSLTVGEGTATLVATVAPENATNKNVVWVSGDEAVARVDDGVVTPVGEGTTTITVITVDGSYTATCEVTVSLPEGATITPESWNVSTDVTDVADGTTVEVGEAILDTQALTITSDVSVKYSSVTNATKPSLGGTPVTAGYKQSDNTPDGSTTGNFIFTAKGDMELTVYITVCNDSYNSHRSGYTITYTVGDVANTTTSENRDVMISITVELKAGQSLCINSTMSGNSGKLWLFGYDVTPLVSE